VSKKILGKIQAKVLVYLAKNPDKHIQAIQFGLNSSNYGAIHNAIKSLEKKNYVQSRKGYSNINIEINYYSCTEVGISYALLFATEDEILPILETNRDKYEAINFFLSEFNRMGKKEFINWFTDYITFIPSLEKDGFDTTVSKMLLFYINKYDKMNINDRVSDLQRVAKDFPNAKIMLRNLQKIMKKLNLGEEND
jgi:DNA-binding PadR family transcriptional regulator